MIGTSHGTKLVFLSTLSLRRATVARKYKITTQKHFYPRSPCGERHITVDDISVCVTFLSTLSLRRATSFRLRGISQNHISIHALLAESDCCAKIQNYNSEAFLSTLSLRRATLFLRSVCFVILPFLSTLSLRRATIIASIGDGAFQDFYPRSPCGERRGYVTRRGQPFGKFLSTLSLRRATSAGRVILSL